ncbi:hypothetical protein CsatA_008955 [Cannabis sativa]
MDLSHKMNEESSLKKGDHIYTYTNKLHTSSLHGIYVGNNEVIYYKSKSKSKSRSESEKCESCKYNPTKERGVVKSCLKCFHRGHGLYQFQYGVSKRHCMIWPSGTCYTGSCIEDGKVIIKNAEKMLKDSHKSRKATDNNKLYDDFDKNSMGFAVMCTTGNVTCIQEIAAMSKTKMSLKCFAVACQFAVTMFALQEGLTHGCSIMQERVNQTVISHECESLAVLVHVQATQDQAGWGLPVLCIL